MPDKIIPNPAWVPLSLQERAAWMQNQNDKAQAEGLNYGLTQANLDQIKDDNNMIQFLATGFVSIDTFGKSWTAFRNGIMTQPIGSPAFEYPDPLALNGPVIPPTGIFQRIIEYRDVVRSSLNYTIQVGESWGYEPVAPQPFNPNDVKPTIKTFEAEHNYHFSIVVAGRAEAVMWDVYIMRKGGEWTKHGSYQGKSADITITPTIPGDPERLQVYIQLRKNNADYGQPSDPAYVTLNP